MALPYPSLSMPSTGSFVANGGPSPYQAGQAYYQAYGGGQAYAQPPEGYYGGYAQQQQQAYGALGAAEYANRDSPQYTAEQQYAQQLQEQQYAQQYAQQVQDQYAQQYAQQLKQYEQQVKQYEQAYGAGATTAAAGYGTTPAAASGYGAEASAPAPYLPTTGSFIANSSFAAAPPLTGTYANLLLDQNAPLGGLYGAPGTSASLDPYPYGGYSARQQSQQSFAYPQMSQGYQFKFYANYGPGGEKEEKAGGEGRSIFVPTPAPKPGPTGADKENRIPDRPSSEKGPLQPKPKPMLKRAPQAAAKKKKGMCGC